MPKETEKKTDPDAQLPLQTDGGAEGPTTESSFEDSVRRLGDIVETLEGGELPLEDSIRLYEEGVRLARAAQARLARAEKRVEELLAVDDDGNPVVRELEPE